MRKSNGYKQKNKRNEEEDGQESPIYPKAQEFKTRGRVEEVGDMRGRCLGSELEW